MAEAHDRLIRRLTQVATLSEEEERALGQLPLTTKAFVADQTAVADGARVSETCLVIEGMLASTKILPDGSRQITSFFMAGDIPDVQGLQLPVIDFGLTSLTKSTVAFIGHSALERLIGEHPRFGAVFWRQTLIYGSVYREWVANVGARSAYARIAHLYCETFTRLTALGLTRDGGFELPLTQSQLADATGLSVVHVNRTLKELRADGLIVVRGRFTQIPDWDKLARAGGFDAAYLHLEHRRAAA